MGSLIEIERPADGIILLTLARPNKLNALSVALLEELAGNLIQAQADSDVGCAIVTGSGRAFSAGADIADQQEFGEDVPFNQGRLASWDTIQNFEKPLIAAVSGYALGGGNELAMLADIIIAGMDAKFGQPEVRIGVFPGDGGTQRLVRAVGKSLAMQMILTGEPIDADTALRSGLISEVVPNEQLLSRANEVGALIVRNGPVALRAAKKSVLKAFELPLAEGLEAERELFRGPFASQDRREGMNAFLDRRSPHFRGR